MRVRQPKFSEGPLHVERIADPATRTATALRELADRVERSGLYSSTFDSENEAFFARGEDIAMLSITHVTIDLKILRHD
jgi:hypothetical protein